MMRRIIRIASLALAALMIICTAASCKSGDSGDDAFSVVATNFPCCDFARQLTAGTDASVKMLLSPGGESHSFDPTPQDIITIGKADVFVYVGGESDTWAKDVIASADNPSLAEFKLMEHCPLLGEEIAEGMETESGEDAHGGEEEYDEHVWTSPVNVIRICTDLCSVLCEKSPENADTIRANLEAYTAALRQLDTDIRAVIDSGKRKTLVFGDRFPLLYFAREYGIDYYAAFPGCSASVEASAGTVAFLIDKVKSEDIPVVLHIELSSTDIAETVAEACDVPVMEFCACHNVSAADFEAGATYVGIMRGNIDVLEAALR